MQSAFSYCKYGVSKMVYRSRKKVNEPVTEKKKKKKASLIDKKVCRESAKLHTGETSRLWSVVLDGG